MTIDLDFKNKIIDNKQYGYIYQLRGKTIHRFACLYWTQMQIDAFNNNTSMPKFNKVYDIEDSYDHINAYNPIYYYYRGPRVDNHYEFVLFSSTTPFHEINSLGLIFTENKEDEFVKEIYKAYGFIINDDIERETTIVNQWINTREIVHVDLGF